MKQEYPKRDKLTQVGISGFSAGGHLAASTGAGALEANGDTTARALLRPDFMVLFYPVISCDPKYSHAGSFNNLLGKGYTAEELDTILTKKSGLIGVSGVSSDAREVWAAVEEGNHRAQLAMDLVVHYARKLIGSYVAEMNGVDVLVITAGLGENDAKVRNGILTNLDFLGVKINEELNMNAPRGTMVDLTAEGSKVKVLVIPTDEELMIAKDTQKLADEFYAK
jgi:hypothetical protein